MVWVVWGNCVQLFDRGAQGIVAGDEFLGGRFAVKPRLRFRSEDRSDYERGGVGRLGESRPLFCVSCQVFDDRSGRRFLVLSPMFVAFLLTFDFYSFSLLLDGAG